MPRHSFFQLLRMLAIDGYMEFFPRNCSLIREVRNRLKGIDLIDSVPDKLWMEVRDIVQETGIKTIPMEKKCEKAK